MQRRKFIAGVGSLAAGAAAVTGTGAFSSATAERSVSVSVVGDASAYLGIETKSGSPYATQTGDGTVEFDFTGNGEGSGLNNNAFTKFNGLFTVRNNGSQPVAVWLNDGNPNVPDSVEFGLGGGADFVESLANATGSPVNSVSAAFFWSFAEEDQPSEYDPFGTDDLGNDFATGLDDDSVLRPDNIEDRLYDRTQKHPPILNAGDALTINVQINTKSDTGATLDPSDVTDAGGNIALSAFSRDFASDF